jgi:hypothetical protein
VQPAEFNDSDRDRIDEMRHMALSGFAWPQMIAPIGSGSLLNMVFRARFTLRKQTMLYRLNLP